MRISALTIQNFLGVPDFRLTLNDHMLFVAGPNGSGKSSLQDAIRFALTDELARGLTKVGDRPQLITDGAAAGFVQLVVDGYEIRRNIGSGKLSGDAPAFPPALPLCLDAPRFASLPEDVRRKWLFALAGVQIKREEIAEQLDVLGIAEPIIERVLPLLRDGFPAAATYAKTKAAEARGAWKAITNEVYGSIKAASWKADMPQSIPTDDELLDARTLVAACEQKVLALTEAKGRVAGALTGDKRSDLQRVADSREARADVATQAELVYQGAVDSVNELSRQIAGHSGTEVECPECHTALVVEGTTLRLPTHAKPSAKLKAELTGAKQAVTLAARAWDEAKVALRESEAAALTLANMVAPSHADLAAPAQLEEERNRLGVYRRALVELEDARARADAAETKTQRAAGAHTEVVEWCKAEEQLGPDGIPAVLLSRALDPINTALATQAEAAGFAPARIERDLSLTYTGRPLRLCSESEQWRAHALFAVVVAVLSGCRLVALDRFDVLEPAVRGEVIDWLLGLTPDALDTVIVSGTLKSAPDLGDGITVAWLGAAA